MLNIKLAMFKACKNCHPTISSPLCYHPLNQFMSGLYSLSSLHWPKTFSIFVIHWPTTHLYFSTHQWLIHSNKRKFTYLSPIGHLPMFTLNNAILEFLPYKLPISKFPPDVVQFVPVPTHPPFIQFLST